MKYTLLEMTQRILESMESDEVSTISETPESASVANIIKECYFDIAGHNNLSEHEGIWKLDASGDNTKPCLMYMPDDAVNLQWLKYNISETETKPEYVNLRFVQNDEFLYYQGMLDPADTDISTMTVTINDDDFSFRYFTNRQPTCYSIFDEGKIIFDAYDSDLESTLTQSRTVAYGLRNVSFTMEDEFVPDLDPRQFQLLLQDAKSTAFIELKQTPNPKAEAKYRKNFILAQKTKDDNDPSASKQKTYRFGRH